jgi:hypothetical protein
VHRKSRLCAAGRPTRNRSGGRQPAVVRITHGVREELRNVRQLSPPQSRAAGVSPPWHGNALAEGSVFCELSRWGSTVGLRRPLLVHGVRSPEKRRFCDMRTHIHKSGGREPAVVRITHGVQEELRNVRQVSPPQSRAAGVSPPWFGNALADAGVFCELSRWGSTVGLRRPLLVHGVRSPEKRRFCDMRTHIHRSGGRQPAVGLGNRTWQSVVYCQFEEVVAGRQPAARPGNAGGFPVVTVPADASYRGFIRGPRVRRWCRCRRCSTGRGKR